MFKFDGNWKPVLTLKEFKIFKSRIIVKGTSEINREGAIQLSIEDNFNDDPDPNEHQLNTINFLLNSDNQISILEELLEYTKYEIYPVYKKKMPYELNPELYPELLDLNSLGKVYKFDSINVIKFGYNNFAYSSFTFYPSFEPEHLIQIAFHKSRIVTFGESIDRLELCEDGDIDPMSLEDVNKPFFTKELKLHHPNPKYNVLKPWQELQNRKIKDNIREFKEKEEGKESLKPKLGIIQRIKYILKKK